MAGRDACANREIAEELIVSVNTVKTHVKTIPRKLGVHDRREAVVRARQLELLTAGLTIGPPAPTSVAGCADVIPVPPTRREHLD